MSEEFKYNKPQGPHQDRPPNLVPPDADAAGKSKTSRFIPMAILGVGLLLAALALLVIFLPMLSDTRSVKIPAESQQGPATVVKPAGQNIPEPDSAAQAEIEALIGDWLHKQAEAEAENIAVWGGQAYAEAVALAEECERLLGEQQYLPARKSCTRAIEKLAELAAAKPVLLEQALLAGTQALNSGEPDAAAVFFRDALAIDAGNQLALAGIQRAANLPKVLQFVKDGSELELSGDTEGALLAFRAAASLDPDYPPAREALKRVESSIADSAFQQSMSQALQALTAGRLLAATKALQQAEALRPGDPAVSDLKQQLKSRRLETQLDSLRQEAASFEQAERWPEALKSCEKALALNARASFATACKERVSRRIDLDKQLQGFLSHPERLFEEGPRNVARQILVFASSIEPRGTRLSGQIERLGELITEAEAEVEVVIKSDGLTEVSIYHVGHLGHFLEKRLVLRTGDYTATGSRNGYRDTRQIFKVRPGSGTLVYTLLCEEPI